MIKRIFKKVKRLTEKSIQKVEDEYLAWLSFANAGMLNPGNVFCIDYAIRNLPSNNPILEIGSFCGLSTNVISYLLKKQNKSNKILTTDKWVFEGAEKEGYIGDSKIKHSDYRAFVMDTFKNNVLFFSAHNLPFPVEAFSDNFFQLWGNNETVEDLFGRELKLGGYISFAYIDGNHTYEYSKKDFLNTSKYLDIGGFILFDDSSDTSPFGCAELMKEILDDDNYELVMKNPNYLFRKIK